MTDLDVWLRAQVTAARVVVARPAAQTEGGRETSRRNWGYKSARVDRPAGVSATAATLPQTNSRLNGAATVAGIITSETVRARPIPGE